MPSELIEMLRALLRGDFDAVDRHMDAAEEDGGKWDATTKLLAAAFWLAVERRFDEKSSLDDIAKYVAGVRSQYPDTETVMAETLIRAARGEDHLMASIDPEAAVPVEMVLLYKLVSDENLSDEQREARVLEAVETAERSFAG